MACGPHPQSPATLWRRGAPYGRARGAWVAPLVPALAVLLLLAAPVTPGDASRSV